MRVWTLVLAAAMAMQVVSARADEARRLALARELMAQTHVSDAMRQSLPVLAAQMRADFAQRGALDGDADAFTKLFRERASAEMDRYTDEMAQAYADLFTEDEMNAVLEFDRTPVGQKLIAATPRLVQASLMAGRKLGEDVAKEVIAEMEAKSETNQPGKL